MMVLQRLSIRVKLVGAILLITISALLAGFTAVLIRDRRTMRDSMLEGTGLMAQVIGDYSVSDLTFGDQVEAGKTLAKLEAVPAIEAACILDSGGRRFAEYHRPGAAPAQPPPGGTRFADGALHFTHPIVFQNETYGTLYLRASTSELDARLRRHLLLMAALLAGLILLAWLAALRLQRLISGPILMLANTARSISTTHDYSVRVIPPGEDEIGRLCEDFNAMLAQIQRRERERDEADQRTREKSTFLANMSHELRTPLNSIIGFSEILAARLSERIEPKERKFLHNINASGQHLLGIVNDILDLSKVEAGHMELSLEPVSVRSAIDGVCTLMKGMAARRDIQLAVELPQALPRIEADPVKFKQILYNLLSNAVKFSPEHSEVTVTARALAAGESPLGVPALQVAVADRGIGIDAKNHDIIFQAFRQVDGTASRQFDGTGLGLALVRKFVELHRGTVRVASALGQGSTFTVVLPLSAAAAAGAPPPDGAAAEPPDTRRQVLVIEDDPGAADLICHHLRAANFLPVRAASGAAGVEMARGLRPAAITLDLVLPDMEGWTVLKTLKADPETRAIPVVIVSMVENRELGLAVGADDYFLKPVDGERLIRRLRGLIPAGDPPPRVLLISDDPGFHARLAEQLAGRGYAVEQARSGAQGLERASAAPPALILVDLRIEQMAGLEVAVRLRADPRTVRVPILVHSGEELSGEQSRRLAEKLAALAQQGQSAGPRLGAMVEELVQRHEIDGDVEH